MASIADGVNGTERGTYWMAVGGFKMGVNLSDHMSNRSTRAARLRFYEETLELGRNVTIQLECPLLGCLRRGDTAIFGRFMLSTIHSGDIVLCRGEEDAIIRRVISVQFEDGHYTFRTRSGSGNHLDAPVPGIQVIGLLKGVERGGSHIAPERLASLRERLSGFGTRGVIEGICDLACQGLPPGLRPARFRR